ncbi:hypothetical protein ABKV19_024745 [Rosa sericea]
MSGEGSSNNPQGYDQWVPTYEYDGLGRSFNVAVDIPDFISQFGTLGVRFGEAPDEPEPQTIELLDHLLNLPAEGDDNERPPFQKQQLIRDMIIICYNYTRSAGSLGQSLTGRFREEHVKIVDGVTKIERIHKSKKNLGVSLKIVIDKVLENHPASPELNHFLGSIENCTKSKDFAALYFQPALCSKMETTYFLLDFALLADFDERYKMLIARAYPSVGQRFEAVPDFKKLMTKQRQFHDTYGGAINCAKTVCHHFNELVGTNLSLEGAMAQFLVAFPSMPLDFFKCLAGSGFPFKQFLSG